MCYQWRMQMTEQAICGLWRLAKNTQHHRQHQQFHSPPSIKISRLPHWLNQPYHNVTEQALPKETISGHR